MTDPRATFAERRERLFAQLVAEYEERFPASHAFQQKASARLVDGGSHALRMPQPFPCWVCAARGAYIYDLDGHTILDFWQGHFANILGHNPPEITEPLAEALHQRRGLQSGMQDVWEGELADLLCQRVGAEMVRFTTSGALATMNAILLARVYTGREEILKVGGGWHGGQPWAFKGVHYGPKGYEGAETEGLPEHLLKQILVTRFNDVEALEETFREEGDRIACLIVEPCIGSGGGILAHPEFLQRARELTHQHGALLIFDEVIDGFRFWAGNLGALYGVQPDLMTLGKIMGGGMPVAAVAGRADVLQLCGRATGRRVRFDGGTYSAHPLSMLAGRLMIQHLVEHEGAIYPRLGAMGARLRKVIERAFGEEGVLVHCTGRPNPRVPASSLAFVQFPYRPDVPMDKPDAVNNPALCDVELRERVVKLAFLLEGVFVVHGFGALSTAHTETDLEKIEATCHAVARRLRLAGLATPL
ncbi:MAG: aspartate aminotransferase family protein [Anaerolineae bacterium]